MKFEDFDLGKKLPYVKSSNLKVIILGGAVLVLMLVTLFVNLYGKTKNNNKNNENQTPTVFQQQYNPSAKVTNYKPVVITPILQEDPVKVVVSFTDLVMSGNSGTAKSYLSPDFPDISLQNFVDEVAKNKDSINFSILWVQYSQDKATSFISIELAKSGVKNDKLFTLVKSNSLWKIKSIDNL